MAKRKTSRRKRVARPMTPASALPVRPVAAPLPMQAAAAPPPPAAAAQEPAPARPRQGSRFTQRDYAYVRRDVQRIVILALGIIIAIVVLSFFLP